MSMPDRARARGANTRAKTAPDCAELVRLLGQLDGRDPVPPFALLRRADAAPGELELLRGPVAEAHSLDEIAPQDGADGGAALALVPYRLAASRGLACHDDEAPLLVMRV